MEPVTHVLTGACLARAGLNRRVAYATVAMAVAAELPDIDVLWGLRGPVAAFQHHRGISHTFVGLPLEGAVVLGAVYGLHRWRTARVRHRVAGAPGSESKAGGRPAREQPLTAAPVRWVALYGCALIALFSHLLLDYTNSYGLRPFFPFKGHWYAASIVSIFDPLLFALLLFGLVAPAIFRLVSAEVGARRRPFASPGWAATALVLVLLLWGVRWVEHGRAVQIAMAQTLEAPQLTGDDGSASQTGLAKEPPPPAYLLAQRALANPDPLSIFRWYTVTDFGSLYQLERVDTAEQSLVATEGTYRKAAQQPAIVAAESSQLGRAYLDWSPMPILSVDSSSAAVEQATAGSGIEPPMGGSVVTLRDPRFMGVLPWVGPGRRTPLTGAVVLDREQHVILQSMDGHLQTSR